MNTKESSVPFFYSSIHALFIPLSLLLDLDSRASLTVETTPVYLFGSFTFESTKISRSIFYKCNCNFRTSFSKLVSNNKFVVLFVEGVPSLFSIFCLTKRVKSHIFASP